MPPLTIRSVTRGDLPDLLALIRELAVYESLEHMLTVDENALANLLLVPHPVAGAMIAWLENRAAGFAFFFENVSTFLGARGLYLEDVYVRPDDRRKGIGLALLREVAREARRRGARFLDWRVLDWNTSAIDFYRKLGARPQSEWIPFRLDGPDLERLI